MPTYKPKLPIIDKFLTKAPSTGIIETTSVASKLMRFKVLLDRETRGFQKVDRDGPKGAYEYGKNTLSGREKLQGFKDESKILNGYTFEPAGKRKQAIITADMTQKIAIIDIDASTNQGGIRTIFMDYIILPFVPRELNYSPSSKFVGIATLGRNNPYYQFTGSEDTLNFEIDWFSSQLDRKDVINNCRWMEALTKADAYTNPPHRIILSWGSDNLLWQDDIWLCVAAPYKLTQFNRGYRAKVTTANSGFRGKRALSGGLRGKRALNNDDGRGEFISTSMLPQQAMQSVTFKRITNINLSHDEIRKPL